MFRDSTLIGIDLGTNSVKIVEIDHQKNRNVLVTYGTARHDIDIEGYWDSTKLRLLSQLIQNILKVGGFNGVRTMLSAPSKQVFVTTMDFDLSLDSKLIDAEIKKQAKFILPYPVDEMRLSWSIIDDDPRIKSYTNKQRVIINALPEFVLENSRNLLEHLNLDGVGLENQTVSQIRATLDKDLGNTVLCDIGSEQISFSIMVDGVLRGSSYSSIGVNKIINDLADLLGVTAPIAENFMKDLTLINLYELPKPLLNGLKYIQSELESFVQNNRELSQTPNKVVMTGGGVYLPGLLEFFKSFEIPVFVANPAKNIFVKNEDKPYFNLISNQLSTAIGLALKS